MGGSGGGGEVRQCEGAQVQGVSSLTLSVQCFRVFFRGKEQG